MLRQHPDSFHLLVVVTQLLNEESLSLNKIKSLLLINCNFNSNFSNNNNSSGKSTLHQQNVLFQELNFLQCVTAMIIIIPFPVELAVAVFLVLVDLLPTTRATTTTATATEAAQMAVVVLAKSPSKQ